MKSLLLYVLGWAFRLLWWFVYTLSCFVAIPYLEFTNLATNKYGSGQEMFVRGVLMTFAVVCDFAFILALIGSVPTSLANFIPHLLVAWVWRR